MNRRPGITLVEVLVAIFIMGIGMIALLTLFPLGALNVAQALKDDRAAQAAANANAHAIAQDLRHDTNVLNAFTAQLVPPNAAVTPAFDPKGPSGPVYVDPFYFVLNQTTLGGVTRISPSYAPGGNAPQMAFWFSLLDDLYYDPTGVPTISAGPTVTRSGRFTWAYMLRRPRLGDQSVVDMSVVVYADRVTQTALGETSYTANSFPVGTPPTNTLTLNYSGLTKPKIRNGSWILDVTPDIATNAATGKTYTIPRGYFYRVVDASEDSTNTIFTLELQTPLKAAVPGTPGSAFTIIVMENVVEVFDRGSGYIP